MLPGIVVNYGDASGRQFKKRGTGDICCTSRLDPDVKGLPEFIGMTYSTPHCSNTVLYDGDSTHPTQTHEATS